jgi:hypothetical protein
MNRRERALFLRGERPHAAEVLDLYLALLDVWDAGATPQAVLAAVEQAGPETLAKALRDMDLEAVLRKEDDLAPAELFLIRACRVPVRGDAERRPTLPRMRWTAAAEHPGAGRRPAHPGPAAAHVRLMRDALELLGELLPELRRDVGLSAHLLFRRRRPGCRIASRGSARPARNI